jgi:LDH2 family malate/lactate/ureidoglycolate dehydrogenase
VKPRLVAPATPEEAAQRLRALGFDDVRAATLVEEFCEVEASGRPSHGLIRVAWLEQLPGLDPQARARCLVDEPGYQLWDGDGALGSLVLAEIAAAQLAVPPERARLAVVHNCSPTNALGYTARKLAAGGFVTLLTANSEPRLAHPDGGPPLAGTNAIAIAIPTTEGHPVVTDVGMGTTTYGHVLLGQAREEDLRPFGDGKAHKALALALGIQLLVSALAGDGWGAVLLVAVPQADPVPVLRELAQGLHLPGDSWLRVVGEPR